MLQCPADGVGWMIFQREDGKRLDDFRNPQLAAAKVVIVAYLQIDSQAAKYPV